MGRLLIFFIAFFTFPIVNAICIVPDKDIKIKENTLFCSSTYNIESGVNIVGDNIFVDCNNSVLIGNGVGYGILLKNKHNVIVQNCNITNYEIGIYLDNTNNSIIKNNYLTKNKFGIALFNSFNNNINDNIFFENINSNQLIYLPTAALQQKEAEKPEIKPSDAEQVIEEVIRIKKPFLEEDEILNEVEAILSRYFNITQQNLEISRTILYNETDNSTRVFLHLKPKKLLLNLSVYEKIPKCVSTYVNQILFEAAGYEVIADDPLILWYFSRLDKNEEISYKVFKNIDEECKKLLLAFGIATGFEEPEKKEKKERKLDYIVVILLIFVGVIIIAVGYFLLGKSYRK